MRSKNYYDKTRRAASSSAYYPSGWQLDNTSLDETLSTVQFWVNGTMLTAQMPLAEAKEKVRKGEAFVISSQAIGAMKDNISQA